MPDIRRYNIPAVFVGQVRLVPDLVCLDLIAVALGHQFHKIPQGRGVAGQAIGGIIGAGRLDDVHQQLAPVGVDCVHNHVEFFPAVDPGHRVLNILPDHLLAHPVEAGVLHQLEYPITVGVVEVSDNAELQRGCGSGRSGGNLGGSRYRGYIGRNLGSHRRGYRCLSRGR